MRIFSTEADGTVNLAKFTSGGTVTTKIGEVAESGWTDFAIVVDLENLLLYGYMKNASGVYELKAVTDVDVPSNYTNAYAWANKVGKIQWEVAHSAVSDDAWNSIVSETERSYLATLSGDEYKTELFRLAKKYFSVGIDNYEILTGNAVD